MQKRAISSGHGEYLVQAVRVDDLGATLADYERWVRPNLYYSNKGPGILIFFHGLSTVANAEPFRRLLESVAPSRSTMRWWLAEFWFEVLDEAQAERLRYLVAIVSLVFPVLTMLPVPIIFWLGRSLAGDGFGLLGAALYPLVPAVGLLVADLDYALYPLCAIAAVAPFAVGVHRRRPALLALSGLAFVLYLSMTMAALSMMVPMLAVAGLDALQRLRRGDGIPRVSRDLAVMGGTFAVAVAAALALVAIGLHFDPVKRYEYAREIQANWGTEYTGSFAVANLLGYFLSFGLAQTAVLFAQQGRSFARLVPATGDTLDHLAVGWLCLLAALVMFGEQHGETNRLWAFLSPLGCVIVARFAYDRLPARALWVPPAMFLAGLILSRYQLSYF
jgi:hypothetical protein